MRKILTVIFFVNFIVLKPQSNSQVIISEVMFYPLESNSEFVEFYNSSETDTIDLNGYKLIYHTSAVDNIVAHQNGTRLNPQSYAVVFEGDYNFDEGIYKELFPANALILKIDNNAFGSSGMSNSTNRKLNFVNNKDDTLQTYEYSADNSAGYSDEKIVLNYNNSASNWANSNTLNGSPGARNTVTPFKFDLVIKMISFEPAKPAQGEDIIVTVGIINRGTDDAGSFRLNLYDDINNDLTAESGELLESWLLEGFISGDSGFVSYQIIECEYRKYNLIAEIDYSADENLINNRKSLQINVAPKPLLFNDIVINEIMYNPSAGEPEWIEIYNRIDKEVDLKNWRIKDLSSSVVLSDSSVFLQPGEFLVLSENESIFDFYENAFNTLIVNLPSLNNSGDVITIIDSLNRSIDSVAYFSSWGGTKNNSLERKSYYGLSNDSSNWSGAVTNLRATPGTINSISQKDFDLTVDSININPAIIRKSKWFSAYAFVKNIGVNKTGNFEVNFYIDSNSDSLAQPNELVFTEYFDYLDSGDSVICEWQSNDLDTGKYYLMVHVDYEQDQFQENNFTSYEFIIHEIPAAYNEIIINEIMYKPPEDEPEWIELFNNSSKTWDLKNWKIRDRSTTAVISEKDFFVPPGSFVVISEDSLISEVYDLSCPWLVINLPSLNNSGDDIVLVNNLNGLVDSVNFKSSWGGYYNGQSLERKLYKNNSNDSTNWGSALQNIRATPGMRNSIQPMDYDLSVESIKLAEEYPVVGQSVELEIVIRNVGLNDYLQATLNIYIARNNNYELVKNLNVGRVQSGDSALFKFNLDIFYEGSNSLIAVVESEPDENSSNDTLSIVFDAYKINEQRGDIIINEIMYAPVFPETEWIELFNRSDKIINLWGFKVADNSDTSRAIIDSIIVNPNSYYLFARDSSFLEIYPDVHNAIITSFPGLNNNVDEIKLLNFFNHVIDSVSYKSSWGGKTGISLERISSEKSSTDSSNWHTANVAKGGTPGQLNSVSQKPIDIKVDGIIFMPEHPIAGENVRIFAIIKNVGREKSFFNLNLLEDTNLDTVSALIVESKLNIEIEAGDSIVTSFDYTITSIDKKYGYQVWAEVEFDGDLSNNSMYAIVTPGYPEHSIVINEIHFNPSDGEPEWIELVNISGFSIDVSGWKIKDVLTTPKVNQVTESRLIKPGEFLIITKDSSIYDYHSNIPCKLIRNNFANLNNDADGIIIFDQFGNKIDSVFYNSLPVNNGLSLERIDLFKSSADSSNWGYSKDIEKSTPGRINSLVIKDYDLAAAKISVTPEFPCREDNVIVTATVKNVGRYNVDNFSIQINVELNELILHLDEFPDLFLSVGDSIFLTSSEPFVITDSATVSVSVVFEEDLEPGNNSLSKKIKAGFDQKSIIITEFLNKPIQDNTEWFELYNNSGLPININDWSVSDVLSIPTKNVITENNCIIQPGEYFIVAGDTLGLEAYSNAKKFQLNFGSLGNTEDGIIIYDFRDAIIDSLFYNKNWNIINGRSIERMNFDKPSGDYNNWKFSLDEEGATPGKINSVQLADAYQNNSLAINEILYEPSESNCEFLEFINQSNEDIDLGGWTHVDGNNDVTILSYKSYVLPAGEILLFAADSSIYNNYPGMDSKDNVLLLNRKEIGLSNQEEIVIKDFFGNTIDSVEYSSKWHNKNFVSTRNVSLERLNPKLNSCDQSNWTSCVHASGATPGEVNSVYTSLKESKAGLSVEPNPFSPDNDGFEDHTIISYKLKGDVYQIRIRIFDDHGRKVRTIWENQPSGSEGDLIFDGLNDSGQPLKIGMYIILFEARENNSNKVEVKKKIVVVARKF